MADVPLYEQVLDRNWERALSEGSRFFEEKSAVQESLAGLARRLKGLAIPYAIAGGMALYRHGFRRFTEDVDVLVTRDGLKAIHEHLSGLGYVPPFTGSKQLRDVATGVRVEFLVTGDFPGDGRPKPVAFPDPGLVGEELDGVSYLRLPTLVELKLASGMTGGVHRLKDLADVVELIKIRGLDAAFATQLDPYVQEKYRELWQGTREPIREP
jgi:hypothetical protein